jgi:lipopolysaccharide biosynthesis protein
LKTLITFIHFDRGANSASRLNLDFFIKLGLTNSSDHHFNFVINSPSGGEKIPAQDNISVIKGHNKGYDFGGYKQSLQSVNLEEFDRFIFVNDTCRGPFLPDYIPSRIWVDIIGNLIQDQIKLVGATWNFNGPECRKDNLHIQSYFFATDSQGINLLLNAGIFNSIGKNKVDVIKQHEVKMSRLLLKSGFKIKPLQLSQYNGDKSGDVCFDQGYYGITLNPLEVMFVKTNRLKNRKRGCEKTAYNYTKWKIQKAEIL